MPARLSHNLHYSVAAVLVLGAALHAQDPVTIHVNAAETIGPYKPISNFFGYDEANFTYAKDGAKLIGELGKISGTKGAEPVYIRTHFMLTTGDGTPGYKWGTTNA